MLCVLRENVSQRKPTFLHVFLLFLLLLLFAIKLNIFILFISLLIWNKTYEQLYMHKVKIKLQINHDWMK